MYIYHKCIFLNSNELNNLFDIIVKNNIDKLRKLSIGEIEDDSEMYDSILPYNEYDMCLKFKKLSNPQVNCITSILHYKNKVCIFANINKIIPIASESMLYKYRHKSLQEIYNIPLFIISFNKLTVAASLLDLENFGGNILE